MASVNITDRTIKARRASTKRIELWDANIKGFVLRIYPSGVKRFYFIYRNVHGERKRVVIGDAKVKPLAEARQDAKELLAKVGRGEDPAAAKKQHKKAETFEQLCELYLDLHARKNKRPRSVREDERIISTYLLPEWRSYKAADIRRRDVISVLDDIQVRRDAPVMANRVRALIHRVFNFALQREIITANPCAGLPRVAKEQSRERVLSEKEIRTLFKVLDGERNRSIASIFKLILLTGQRPGEVAGMRWDEIEGDVWTVPKERTKNNTTHKIPISPLIRSILEDVRQFNAHRSERSRKDDKDFYEKFVFPSRYGSPAVWINKKARELVATMDVERWTPHDLRRTCATYLENSGIPSDVIDQIQNHKKRGVKAVYQRGDRWNEMQRALNKWARTVSTILEGKQPSKVVALG